MSLMMPKPENLRGQYGSYVTSDVYHIAERLWELGQSVNVPLYVSTPERPIVKFGRTYNFVISEGTPVGERFVMYAEELDARIVERCERCLKIPFGQRFDRVAARPRRPDRHPAHRLHPAGDRDVVRAGDHALGREVGRLLA